jgi:glycosyltransferase involved in cell wall biosynthesis
LRHAVFTIASKNYFSYVKTLMRSLKEFEPDWDRYVILVDEYVDQAKERPLIEVESLYKLIKAIDLGLPNPYCMFFRYSILELNTAVKPWGFEWLFNNDYDTVVYLDPDICVYSPMTELENELKSPDKIVLIPHITDSVPEDNIPNEQALMRFGVYNLGFIGLRKGQETLRLIKWWQSKLEYDCIEDLQNGIYVDQKWMDIIPAFFKNVTILRHSGYNVAYWNQKIKTVTKEGGSYLFNGQRLVFFHFSHVNLLNTNIKPIKELSDDYLQRQVQNGIKEIKKLQYAYDKLSDGTNIPYPLRVAYRKERYLQEIFGENPFKQGKDILTVPAIKDDTNPLPLTVIMDCIWKSRPDLQQAFPLYMTEHRSLFAQWFVSSAEREYDINHELVETIKKELKKGHSQKTNKKQGIGLKARVIRFIMIVGLKMRPVLKLLPKTIRSLLFKRFVTMSNTIVETQTAPSSGQETEQIDIGQKKGVNLFSYIKGEFSIGEVGRIIARGINTTDVPFSIIDISGGSLHSFRDSSWDHKITESQEHNVNLFAFNADSVTYYYNKLGPSVWEGRYNIGYWNWELPDFPDRWKIAFSFFNEIWTGSRFVADALSIKSPVPIIRIPLTVQLNPDKNMDREYFKLPKDKFLFLCMYDVLSVQSRKNPQGAVNAFKKAFSKDNTDVCLVIKVNNAQAGIEEIASLKDSIKGYHNIYLIDRTLTRCETDSLINVIDVYVSLHRSEGFGLVLAESMYLGKPVVATNWSANTDFMTSNNSCPVNYKLVELGEAYGPYEAYQHWAEPDEEHAGEYMKRLFLEREYYNKIAIEGQNTIRTNYSPEAMGQLIKKRLNEIGML